MHLTSRGTTYGERRMPTSAETVQEFIAAFIAAWPQGDAATLGPFFSEDAVYHNMPMEPVHGSGAILATLAGSWTWAATSPSTSFIWWRMARS
jgi:limonene-1,2-epoxide hydrolase